MEEARESRITASICPVAKVCTHAQSLSWRGTLESVGTRSPWGKSRLLRSSSWKAGIRFSFFLIRTSFFPEAVSKKLLIVPTGTGQEQCWVPRSPFNALCCGGEGAGVVFVCRLFWGLPGTGHPGRGGKLARTPPPLPPACVLLVPLPTGTCCRTSCRLGRAAQGEARDQTHRVSRSIA